MRKELQKILDATLKGYAEKNLDGASFNIPVNMLLKMLDDGNLELILRSLPEDTREKLFARSGEYAIVDENPSRFSKKKVIPPVEKRTTGKKLIEEANLKQGSNTARALLITERSGEEGATSVKVAKGLKIPTDRACRVMWELEQRGLIEKNKIKKKDLVPNGPRVLYKAVG